MNMDLETVDHLLTTTHSVRKRLDLSRPVEPEVIERCIDIALHAPTGGNRQGWHFVVVTDAQKRAAVAGYYAKSWYANDKQRATTNPRLQSGGESYVAQTMKVRDSAQYLADHMHEVPVLVLPCIDGRPDNSSVSAQAGLYGSILPAAWSFMLALRARGLGAAWTTLHLSYEKEVATLLGIPANVTQAALLPVAYFTGDDFKAATRLPAKERTYWNGWGRQRLGR
jgi:nitroreductase